MAMLLMMAFSALSIVTYLVMKAMLRRANAKLAESGENLNLYTL
jgi:hypothetical protein